MIDIFVDWQRSNGNYGSSGIMSPLTVDLTSDE